MKCPDAESVVIDATSTTAIFPRPIANFDVISFYFYSRYGEVFQIIASNTSIHILEEFKLNQTTEVTLSVAGKFGYGAECIFTVEPAEGM